VLGTNFGVSPKSLKVMHIVSAIKGNFPISSKHRKRIKA